MNDTPPLTFIEWQFRVLKDVCMNSQFSYLSENTKNNTVIIPGDEVDGGQGVSVLKKIIDIYF